MPNIAHVPLIPAVVSQGTLFVRNTPLCEHVSKAASQVFFGAASATWHKPLLLPELAAVTAADTLVQSKQIVAPTSKTTKEWDLAGG